MQTPLDPLVMEMVNKLDDNLREEFEERAGIVEFDGKFTRSHAECLALLDVLRRHPEALAGFWALEAEVSGKRQFLVTTHRKLAFKVLNLALVLDGHFHGTAQLTAL